MAHVYKKHYTRDEARALLPRIRQWLGRITKLRRQLQQDEKALSALLAEGNDVGGDIVNRWIKALADLREILVEFHARQIEIKDLDRGLIDFPAILDGKEVFLCWELDEEDIEFWHELDAGFAGREKL